MEKVIYDHRPEAVERYDRERDIVNLNIEERERVLEGEAVTEYEADTIVVPHPATYARVVDALVRERYTVSEELALLRQRESKADEFADYDAYVEGCKAVARTIRYR